MTRLALAAAAILAHSATAEATHQVDFRYVVLGYVKDAQGQPLHDVEVRLIRDKTGLIYYGDTDAKGFYVILARLGDESLGETLTIEIDEARARITVRFDPQNHDDERGTRVDLAGDTLIERSAWFRPTLVQYLERPAR